MREKYRDASDAVRDLESKISDIDKRIAADYGPDMRFEALSRECIEFTPGGEWNYEICPFRDAKQKGKDGKSRASAGPPTSAAAASARRFPQELRCC